MVCPRRAARLSCRASFPGVAAGGPARGRRHPGRPRSAAAQLAHGARQVRLRNGALSQHPAAAEQRAAAAAPGRAGRDDARAARRAPTGCGLRIVPLDDGSDRLRHGELRQRGAVPHDGQARSRSMPAARSRARGSTARPSTGSPSWVRRCAGSRWSGPCLVSKVYAEALGRRAVRHRQRLLSNSSASGFSESQNRLDQLLVTLVTSEAFRFVGAEGFECHEHSSSHLASRRPARHARGRCRRHRAAAAPRRHAERQRHGLRRRARRCRCGSAPGSSATASSPTAGCRARTGRATPGSSASSSRRWPRSSPGCRCSRASASRSPTPRRTPACRARRSPARRRAGVSVQLPSIDQLIAPAIGGGTTYPTGIHVGISNQTGATALGLTISYRGPNARQSAQVQPGGAVQELLGFTSNGTPRRPPRPGARLNRSRCSTPSPRTRRRCKRGWAPRIRCGSITTSRACTSSRAGSRRLADRRTRRARSSIPTSSTRLAATTASISRERGQAFSDLLVFALASDLTRVFSYMFTCPACHGNYADCGLDPTSFHEDYGHRLSAKGLSAATAGFNTGVKFAMSNLADMLARMKDTPDGAGNLLDNSCVYTTSCVSESQTHGGTDYPAARRRQGGRQAARRSARAPGRREREQGARSRCSPHSAEPPRRSGMAEGAGLRAESRSSWRESMRRLGGRTRSRSSRSGRVLWVPGVRWRRRGAGHRRREPATPAAIWCAAAARCRCAAGTGRARRGSGSGDAVRGRRGPEQRGQRAPVGGHGPHRAGRQRRRAAARADSAGSIPIIDGPPPARHHGHRVRDPDAEQSGLDQRRPDGHIWFTHQSTAPSAHRQAHAEGTTFILYKTSITNTGPVRHRGRPRRQRLVHEAGRHRPHAARRRDHRVRRAERRRLGAASRWAPTATSGSPSRSHNRIGRVTPAAQFHEFDIPTPNSGPLAITARPRRQPLVHRDGRHREQDRPHHAERATFTEFPIPTPASNPSGITQGPRRQPLVHRARRRTRSVASRRPA